MSDRTPHADGPTASTPPARPHLRRPRQQEVHTYRIRIDLVEAEPPIWRVLDVPSDLMLDDLHVVIQVAFGWNDSHLHRFAVGGWVWGRESELFLCPFDVDEGEDEGTPEEQVRLDEVLVEPGDVLSYVYDYGDNWQHSIRLEAATEREPAAATVVCVNGRRAGPPDDSGGVSGYAHMLEVAADPSSAEHAETMDWLTNGGDTEFDPERFYPEAADRELESALHPAVRSAYHSGQVGDLLRAVQGRGSGAALLDVVKAAALDQPVLVDTATGAEMVARFTWLLHRIGDEGIKLTAAGYLPPVHVGAAMTELGMHREWIGKGNREDQTLPVLELREATQLLGLARKQRGRLLLTKLGQRLRHDPLALWWHIARRLPLHKPGSSEFQAGLVALALVAAGDHVYADENRHLVARVLTDLGWMLSSGEPITDLDAYGAVRDTTAVLGHLGGFEETRGFSRTSRPTAGGRVLARAALTAS